MFEGYADRYEFAVSDQFLKRIQTAITHEAIEVCHDNGNPQYKERHDLAMSVIANPAYHAQSFSFAVLSNLGFDDSSNDPALQMEVKARWNDVAGL